MNIRTIDYKSPAAGQEFARSLHDTGFAMLRNHPVPGDLLDRLYDNWRTVFASDVKYRYHFDPDSEGGARAGFFPQQVSETAVGHPERDLKEFFHVVTDGPLPPECAGSTTEYQETALGLGISLLESLQQYTPASVTKALSEPLHEMLCLEASVLRILHYPPLQGSENPAAVRAAAHEDINLLTILPVSDQPGLQVKDTAGNWIDVAGNEGDLVINCGDMMSEATGGHYPSTPHRVLNPGGNIANVARISIPFFLTPRLDVVLSERYTAGDYLDERLRIINR